MLNVHCSQDIIGGPLREELIPLDLSPQTPRPETKPMHRGVPLSFCRQQPWPGLATAIVTPGSSPAISQPVATA